MNPHRSAGFTLLEIVVALAVFGFLLFGLSQTVRFGLTAWRQETRISEGKTDLEAVDRSLRSILENLDPGSDTGQPAVQGSSDAITGLTRSRTPDSGLAAVPIEAGLAVSGDRLVLRWRHYHHSQPFGPPARLQEVALIGGVARIGLEYWPPSGGWVSSWSQPDLPLLIRLRISFAGGGASGWPDIVVAPRLSRP